MADVRRIKKVWKAKPTIEGAGVHLKRVFGYHEVPQLDPFLLLDDFRSNDPAEYVRGFPWHPHRGIETITYVLAGDVEHGDRLGNRGVISSGDVQWMTAGSGIIHHSPWPEAAGRPPPANATASRCPRGGSGPCPPPSYCSRSAASCRTLPS